MNESAINRGEIAILPYENIPKITDFDQEEYSNYFFQPIYAKKSDTDLISRPFGLTIIKQEIDAIFIEGNISLNIMSFFINYVQSALSVFKINRPGYIVGLNIFNYSQGDKILTFEYLKNLRNVYKDRKEELLTKEQNLFIVFFYNGRWLLSIFDLKREKCNIIDFLDKNLSKSSNDEIYDLIKVFLKQEFDLKPSSVSFFDKHKIETNDNCGLFVCKFLANYFLSSMEYEKINVSIREKSDLKKVLAWLIIKIDQVVSTKGSIRSLSRHSFQPLLPTEVLNENKRGSQITNIRGTLISPKPNSSNKSLKDLLEETKKGQKVKITRAELADMLNKVKAEVIEELDSEEDISHIIGEEGLFENSTESKEALSKSHLKDLIRKAKNNKRRETREKNTEASTSRKDQPMTYEEYVQQAQKRYQEQMEFQNMLTFLQGSNPTLYGKVAEELNSQIEDKFLSKFSLLHVKYPGVPRPSQNSLLSAQSSNRNQKLSSFQRDSIGGSSVVSLNSNDRQTPKQYTLYNSLYNKTPNSETNPLNTAFNKYTTTPTQYSFASPQKPITPYSPLTPSSTSRSVETPVRKANYKNGSIFFNAGKSAFNTDNNPHTHLVAKRYGIKITRLDYQRLKTENVLTNEMLNFFVGFLREKQAYIPSDRMKFYELNTFYFGTEFYDALTNNNPSANRINFENVKTWTSKYSSNGKTIFENFHKTLIFIKMRSNECFALVYINNVDKKVYLFDPNKPRDNTPTENPVLLNIMNYIDMEYQHKANKRADRNKWQLLYGNIMKVSNPSDSGIIIAKIGNCIQKGNLQSQFSDEKLVQFRTDLLNLILKIGITEGSKDNMNWITDHPI